MNNFSFMEVLNKFNENPEKYIRIIMGSDTSIDWSQVEVDTPIYVKGNRQSKYEVLRFFAKYEDGWVYAWDQGMTSLTAEPEAMVPWNFARLAESE